MDDINNALEAEKNAFKHECYEAYELRWMIAHGNTLQEFVDALGDIAAESVEEDLCRKHPSRRFHANGRLRYGRCTLSSGN